MLGIPLRARRASPRIRPSRLGSSSSMSSQTRATSSASSLWRVRVSGHMDFIPTKTSYLFAFKWRNQACALSEPAEEAGQTSCSALGGSPSHPAPASADSERHATPGARGFRALAAYQRMPRRRTRIPGLGTRRDPTCAAPSSAARATRQLAEHSRERIELHDVPTSARPSDRWSGDPVRGRGVDWQMTLDDSRCKLKSVYVRIVPGRKPGRRVQQCCRHSRQDRACRRSDG